MKKIFAMLLALICILSLFSCGADDGGDNESEHNHGSKVEREEKDDDEDEEGEDAETLDLLVKFSMPDEEDENELSEIFRYEFELETTGICSVLEAVEYALGRYEIDYALTADGDYFGRLRNYGGDKRESRCYWQLYYNGELSEGKDSSVILDDGAVIEYRWVSGSVKNVRLIFNIEAENKDVFKYDIPELVPDENGSVNIISAVYVSFVKYDKIYELDASGSHITRALGYNAYERVDSEKAIYGYWECYLNDELVKKSQTDIELEDNDVIKFVWIEGELSRNDN